MTSSLVQPVEHRSPARVAVWLLATACLALFGAIRAPAAEPATSAEIDRWVEELSDDAYLVRREAADRLLAAGSAARPALVKVADGPDPETRAAARRLVALIDRGEFDRRLQAFLADADGKVTLPGWEKFRDLVGDDARSRALFVEMQRAERALLEQMFGPSATAPDRSWEDELYRLLHGSGVFDRRRGPSLGSCLTMLFLGSLPERAPSDRAAMDLARLAEFPMVREAIQSSRGRSAVRRLVAAWIVHCANRNPIVVLQRLRLALTYELAEAVPLAVAVARDPEYLTVPPGTRVIAILMIGRFGGREHVADLEPLLEDATACMPARMPHVAGRPVRQVQIRDVALAVILHLAGQDLQQYGFPAARRHVRNLFDPASLYMPTDADRTVAIDKWRQWKADRGGGK